MNLARKARRLLGRPEPFRASAYWKKTDIINWLVKTHGYRSYLEICTVGTGGCFREIDGSTLLICHRLMSRCPDDFSDGMTIDFRIAGSDIWDCVQQLKTRQLRYDVILVDPWHEYHPSYRAIEAALELVAERGTIIVHDCLPPTKRCANPTYLPGEWCGVTYKAFIDFVLSRGDITYQTVDVDYGCGIIRKRRFDGDKMFRPTMSNIGKRLFSALIPRPARAGSTLERDRLVSEWKRIGNEFSLAFSFLHKNKRALLKLVSVRQFRRSDRQLYCS